MDASNKANHIGGLTEEYACIKSIYTGLASSQILNFWANTVGIELEDYSALAIRLGTTQETIRSWAQNEAMPSVDVMHGIHKLILITGREN